MTFRKPSIQRQLELYRADLAAAGYSQETIRNYMRVCNEWAAELVTPVEYLSGLYSRGLKKSSVSVYRAGLKAFFQWRHERGYIRDNPMRNLKSPRMDQTITRSLSTNEVARLLAACDELGKQYDIGDDGGNLGRMPVEVYRARTAAMVALQVSSGLRLGETLRLSDSDIDLRQRSGIVYGKGGKERVFRISLPAKRYIQRWMEMRSEHVEQPAFLFCTSKGTKVDPSTYRKQLRDAAWWAGLGQVTPHLLRHTFATRLSEAGLPAQKLQLMLGHSNITTTMRYIHESRVREAWKLADEVETGLDTAEVPG